MSKWAKVIWQPGSSERYCVDSGKAVAVAGDRCRAHGADAAQCFTATRAPRCEHVNVSPNHPYPKCEECGRSGTGVTSPSQIER